MPDNLPAAFERDTVDVWCIPLDYPSANREWLDSGEQARLLALATSDLRHRFAVAHAATREILGTYVGRAPSQVIIGRRSCQVCGARHGKPEIQARGIRLEFNLSHCRRLALLAVALRDVGVDLESCERAAELGQIAETVLNDEEIESFQSVPKRERPMMVLQRWTQKEAVLKLIGAGLIVPFRMIRITDDGRTAQLVAGVEDGRRAFELVDLAQDLPLYSATLAVAPPRPNIRWRSWPGHIHPIRDSERR